MFNVGERVIIIGAPFHGRSGRVIQFDHGRYPRDRTRILVEIRGPWPQAREWFFHEQLIKIEAE